MFALEVKVEAFASNGSDGRKSYTKGTIFKWDVEFGSLTLELLLSSLCKELNLSSAQKPTVWFYDKRLHEDVRLANEIQMVDMFEMYKEERSCQVVVGVFDKVACLDDEFDALEPLCVVPPDVELGNLDANMPTEPTTKCNVSADDIPKAAAVDVDVVLDMFHNAEEYVGVDDEAMYILVLTAQATGNAEAADDNAQSDNAQASENAFASGIDNDDNVVLVVDEAEVGDKDPLDVHVLHDPLNPKIQKGELFPDIIAFRKAIRHYAVVKGFEFAPRVRTDKTRFIARCAASDCLWRIHASTIFDKKNVQVSSYQPYYALYMSICVTKSL